MPSLGNNRRFYLSNASHSSFTWIEAEQSNSFSRSAETIDISDKSDNWAVLLAGKKSASGEVTVNLDNSSSGEQHDLLNSFTVGSSIYCFIGVLSGTTPSEGDFFEAVITAINDTSEKDSVSTRSISFQTSGAPTHYPATSND